MRKSDKFSDEVRERAVRMVLEHQAEYDSQWAAIESISGLYKAEVIHRRSWASAQAVELATLEWIDWFNNTRLLGPIGNIPPAEAEAACYQQLHELAIAA